MATSSTTPDFGTQRHQFILQYYSMAVQDLTRHLGIGWQTLTSVVGTVAVISLSEDHKLPAQIAVSAAIGVAFWGILNILDASFWATRAIAFLANVEAVYFYEFERRVFNPYVGSHPGLKVLNSLRYQLYAALVMLFLACTYYIKRISDATSGFATFLTTIRANTHLAIFYWSIPSLVFFVMLERALTGRHNRIKEYRDFVIDCPGPGLVKDLSVNRGVNLAMALDASQLTSGAEVQKKVRDDLVTRERVWKKIRNAGRLVSWLMITLIVVAILFKNCLIQ